MRLGYLQLCCTVLKRGPPTDDTLIYWRDSIKITLGEYLTSNVCRIRQEPPFLRELIPQALRKEIS